MTISYLILRPSNAPVTKNTKRIGVISEAAVLLRFRQLGFRISIPFGEESPYDLIVESPDDRLYRIQVKTGRIRRGVVRFRAVSLHHHRGRAPTRYDGRIDFFAVYCPDNDECYLIDVADDCVTGVYGWLRISPPLNNMRRGIHWASDYVMPRTQGPEPLRLGTKRGALDGD